MLSQLLVSIVCLFFLLVALMVFFIRHKPKVPYYRVSQKQCVDLLFNASQGALLEGEWYAFIGMSIRDNEALEALRVHCLSIDEFGVKGTNIIDGRSCMSFNKEGTQRLEMLLDEWRHKANYLV
jgi:hypothetical protein